MIKILIIILFLIIVFLINYIRKLKNILKSNFIPKIEHTLIKGECDDLKWKIKRIKQILGEH